MHADTSPTEPAAPSTLAERIKQVLEAAGGPLEFSKIKKAVLEHYPKSTKKAPQPAQPTEDEIRAELKQPGIFEHPPANKPKYGLQPPPPSPVELMRRSVRDKLAHLGDGPFAAEDLGKPHAKTGPEANAFKTVIQEFLDTGLLFEHPSKKYGKKQPPPPPTPLESMRRTVHAKYASLGEGPFTAAKLGKPSAGNDAAVALFEQIVAELKAERKLFDYPGGKYGKKEPPPSPVELMRRTVRDKLAHLGDGPFSAEDLGKPQAKTGPEANAFKAVVRELIQSGHLFEHPGQKYGKKEPPPPKWYRVGTFSKSFPALEKAADKLVQEGAKPEAILIALREHFGMSETKPSPEVRLEPRHESKVVEPIQLPSPPKAEPTKDLRSVLREAYDHLCLFVEFRHKLVEIRRLYHEAHRRMPELTVARFHDELWSMSSEWLVELHVLNEVSLAQETNLAMYRDDRLYYFIRWK